MCKQRLPGRSKRFLGGAGAWVLPGGWILGGVRLLPGALMVVFSKIMRCSNVFVFSRVGLSTRVTRKGMVSTCLRSSSACARRRLCMAEFCASRLTVISRCVEARRIFTRFPESPSTLASRGSPSTVCTISYSSGGGVFSCSVVGLFSSAGDVFSGENFSGERIVSAIGKFSDVEKNRNKRKMCVLIFMECFLVFLYQHWCVLFCGFFGGVVAVCCFAWSAVVFLGKYYYMRIQHNGCKGIWNVGSGKAWSEMGVEEWVSGAGLGW